MIDEAEVQERLRRTLNAIADTANPEESTVWAASVMPAGRPRRRRALVVAAMCCCIGATGVAVAATRNAGRGHDAPTVLVAPTSIVPALTFALRPVESTSSAPCESPLVAGTARAHGCYKLAAPILGVAEVESAAAVADQNSGQWQVDLTVTDAAAPRFDNSMQRNDGHQLAIVIDGQVVAAPTVNPGITGKHVTITGNLDEQTAERIAAGLTKPEAPDLPSSTDAP